MHIFHIALLRFLFVLLMRVFVAYGFIANNLKLLVTFYEKGFRNRKVKIQKSLTQGEDLRRSPCISLLILLHFCSVSRCAIIVDRL